ncbi:MAG: ribosome biogenesis GTPase Der [Ichthyobacteriaceae bacterium]|nr:ribosome biogenesis GTPase Der [Ichthyobacteriaceae bacterium]
MRNIVAIVGRPNVGKSTFFNRLTQRRQAIVDSVSGVTRDRHYGHTDWNGHEFSVIDTGGYIVGSDDIFEGEIRKQVYLAIEEANAIVFVVDVESGVTSMDMEVAQILRKSKKPVHVMVNKVDNSMRYADAVEFYSLGLGEYFTVAAISGSGTGELLDAVVESLDFSVDEEEGGELPRFAVVGRPNAGKSSFINVLLGEERNIVTDIAGTTRDSIDSHYNRYGNEFTLVDTAGLRKKTKVSEDLEFYSVMRSIRAIENCDVCMIMLDAKRGIEQQDLNIFHLAEKNRKGIIVLVNKWDLVEGKDSNTPKNFEAMVRSKTAPFTDFPIVFISALTKQRVFKAVEEALEVYKNRTAKIPTSKLNEIMLEVVQNSPPPALKGKFMKIKYCMQLPTYTPQFAFFANLPQYIKEPYRRFIENQMRERFDLSGVPISIYFRKK